MGKFRNLANRLSKPNNQFDDSRLKFDARLKLNANTRFKVTDAREILNKKKPNLQRSIQNEPKNADNKNEPLVIVTGLGNVRRNGDKVHVLKRNDDSIKASHHVVSDGHNTFVTLSNELALNKSHQNKLNDFDILREDKTDNKIGKTVKNYEPIRIKITNSNYNATNSTQPNSASLFTNSNLNSFSFNTINRNNSTVNESMDYEANLDIKPLFSRTNSTISNSNMFTNIVDNQKFNNNISINDLGRYNKEGYKLIVSNLHPRVTEDDVLELFSDIGPIKRARFLDKGLAEVVYVRLEHAKDAINKYDQKELDGRQMIIDFADKSFSKDDLKDKMKKSFTTNSFTQNIPETQTSYLSQSISQMNTPTTLKLVGKDTLSNKFKMLTGNKDVTSVQLSEISKKHDLNNKVAVDNTIIHQVLFNKKSSYNASPVTFTVKL